MDRYRVGDHQLQRNVASDREAVVFGVYLYLDCLAGGGIRIADRDLIRVGVIVVRIIEGGDVKFGDNETVVDRADLIAFLLIPEVIVKGIVGGKQMILVERGSVKSALIEAGADRAFAFLDAASA